MLRLFNKISDIFDDHLYRNSVFSVLSRILNAAAGFLFWVIAAKFYSIQTVGTATALISSLNLIMLFSRFGFDISVIRYVTNTEKNKIFNTSFAITTAGTFCISLIYVLFVVVFEHDFILSLPDAVFFILISLFNSIFLISGSMFLALRKAHNLFAQTIFVSFRIFLLIPLAHLTDFGIFISLGLCYVISVIYSLYILRKEIKLSLFQIDAPFIKESFKFSAGNYLSNILTEAPAFLLPIITLFMLGQEDTAKYYMAMAIGNLILIVPNSLNLSLLVEGSHGQPVNKNIIKVFSTAFLSILPLMIIISVWGKSILGLLSKEYTDAYDLLITIIISGFFEVIYMVYISVQNINMRVERNIKINFLRFILLVGASILSIKVYSINGVGYALLLTNVIITLLIAVNYIKNKKNG
jgi:O-antigen/teichoic acid export membrane protein